VTVCFDGLALAKFSAQVPYIITEKLLLDKASMFYIIGIMKKTHQRQTALMKL